ncbi:MAG: hypothetical protein A3F72_11640 [Bacteroidetes bacterium RIFCSPLOWO2_12_FULL_35_15]|nr:MAG: hypothetical protein A3F72_11640 [Bacteroidetes bacterium RIFCSPLOWO2_12_FULL_35_15]
MKKLLILIILLSVFAINGKAQYVSGELAKINILPEQTVSVILTTNETIDAALQEAIKLYWKKCKYEFVTLDEIAGTKKIGDYIITPIDAGTSGGAAFGSSYSTTAVYTTFAKSNKEISDKVFEEYKKSKSEYGFRGAIILNTLVNVVFDTKLLDGDLFKKAGQEILFQQALKNAITLNIKTINWIIAADSGIKATGEMARAMGKYNSNSCELNKMILLVSSSDAIKRGSPYYIGKDFDLNEFKQHYKFDAKIETPEKIKEYISSDKNNKYALLIHAFYSRSPVVLIIRLTDGAILYGKFISSASFSGFTNRTYKQFDDVCN